MTGGVGAGGSFLRNSVASAIRGFCVDDSLRVGVGDR